MNTIYMQGKMVIPNLLDQALQECMPKLTLNEQNVSLQVYRLLAEGLPVPIARVAAKVSLSEMEVRDILRSCWGVVYDNQESVVGYMGLSLKRTSHHFHINGKQLFTWCAWDTLFIPELIGKEAEVISLSPQNKEEVRFKISPQGIITETENDIMMSFIQPDTARIETDVISNFCHYVHFFSSKPTGKEWTTKNPGTFLLSLKEAFVLAKKKNRYQYTEVPFTPE